MATEKFNSYSKIAKGENDSDDGDAPGNNHAGRDALVSWVINKVEDWEKWRDQNFKDRWNEYYRLWRGIWISEDKTRDSERSRLINPALQQAVEAAVSEQEEATFGREKWFDVSDDVADPQREDMEPVRDMLIEDFKRYGVNEAISEIYLNAALYGTGIGKLVIEEVDEKMIGSLPDEETQGQIVDGVFSVKRTVVKLEPVSPDNFVIDIAVNRQGKEGIEQALGCACITTVPRHKIEGKQHDEDDENDLPSTYYKGKVGSITINSEDAGKGEPTKSPEDAGVEVVEYYGKVPKQLLEASEGEATDSMSLEDIDESDLVEAYVTIANRSFLLRGYENPNVMQDRPIVAYAFDVVPNRFWGRGIAEKAYNPQKALDGILRAQMDGLALTVHPMLAGDATRLPRGMALAVKPGKMLLTNGNPNEILREFRFGSIDPMSYTASGDLERMIQMATGSMDSASPLRTNRRNETASGMSMIMGGVLKRAKRTLQNIERNFLEPLIQKALWRYMYFEPERYQPADYVFITRGTLGMMAREIEQQQFIELMAYVPPETPVFFTLLKGVIESSSVENKEEIKSIIDQMLQPQPPDPVQQQATEQELQRGELQNAEIESRVVRNYAKIQGDRVNTKSNVLKALRQGGKNAPV